MTYIYTLSDENKIRYIGKTKSINKRYSEHINQSKNKKTYKEKWVNSTLLNGGKIIIEILDVCDDKDANEVEMYWISQFKVWGFKLVNLTNGGDGGSPMLGKKHSSETKFKMSETAKKQNRNLGGWNKGLKMSENFRKKISEISKGRIVTDNTRKKISETLKGKKRTPMNDETKLKISKIKKGVPSPNKGKKYDEDIRKKMSISKVGHKRSELSKKKQSESNKMIWTIKTPKGDILKFLGYNLFKDYVKKNNLLVSVTTLKSYGKNKGWEVIDKIKNN
jgi:group I intron endonuclease